MSEAVERALQSVRERLARPLPNIEYLESTRDRFRASVEADLNHIPGFNPAEIVDREEADELVGPKIAETVATTKAAERHHEIPKIYVGEIVGFEPERPSKMADHINPGHQRMKFYAGPGLQSPETKPEPVETLWVKIVASDVLGAEQEKSSTD